jgi:hypothetical protein
MAGLPLVSKSRAEIADEIEGWASGAFAAGKRPDILSATEAVADHWQEIVAALRESTAALAPASIHQRIPLCEKCGEPYVSIPRMGIGHLCGGQSA